MKKILCVILALAMIITVAPIEVFASESNDGFSYVRNIKLKASANSKTVTIKWSIDVRGAKVIKGFDLYKRINGKSRVKAGKVKVKKTVSRSDTTYKYRFDDTAPSELGYVCEYEIWPYYRDKNNKKRHLKKISGKVKASYISNSLVTLKTTSSKVTIKLKALPDNPKYIIRYTKYNILTGSKFSPKYHTTKKKKYTIKKADTNNYGYIIEVMPSWKRIRPNKGTYNNTHDIAALINSQTEYEEGKIDVINTKGEISYVHWTQTVSSKDKQIIAAFFESVYHGNYPSKLEMAKYALEWINKNITYAYDYGSIENLSYVEAIFIKRKGQCLQYNGAFAAVLNYLGYKSRIIEGYRARGGVPSIQHFWCECYLDGHWYVCETGNYGKNGNWKHFMKKYSEARGYTKNGKPATDI